MEQLEARRLLSAGLNDTVWHPNAANPNLNDAVFGGTNGTLVSVTGYAASHAASAAYSFVNANDQFNYSGGASAITPAFIGGDAAGPATTDTANVSDTIFDAQGYFASTSGGAYTFTIGNGNGGQADDIVGIYVGGNGTPGSGTLVAADGWQGASSPFETSASTPGRATLTLPAGSSIPVEIIFGNGYGGAYLNGISIVDPNNVPVAYSTTAIPGDPLPAPTAPVLSATPGNGQVALAWMAGTFASSYSVYRVGPGSTLPMLLQAGINGTSYLDATAANNVAYSYYVTADGATASTKSNVVTATPAVPAPVPAVNVLTHHEDAANDGLDASETVLTPGNVNAADFGKQFAVTLDGGYVAAQPLYMQNLDITAGANAGVHSVVFVATEADGLYALDANAGTVLWHDNFTNVTDPTKLSPTSGVTTVKQSDIANNPDVGPQLGILATPAIDPNAGTLYLNANTRELRPDGTHFVQRLWAIHLADGTPVTAAPTVIGDTIANQGLGGTYRYVAGPIINGTGNNNPTGHATPTYPNTDGWAAAPGGRSGYVVAFNAIIQMERTAVTLVNGNVYLGFASHGDNGPYYGWVLGFNASTLALNAAFNTTPTYEPNSDVQSSTPFQSDGGVWMSGSNISTDGTYLYLSTGNGAFNGKASNFDVNGFPIDHDYGDSVLKLAVDPNSTPAQQNGSGWGLAVADYFTPSNQYELNALDLDLGSGGVTVLPNAMTDAAGNPMLLVGGKESRIYLLDRDNLGKFNDTYPATSTSADPRLYDHVLGEYPNNGVDQGGRQVYSSASLLGGNFYIGIDNSAALAFNVANFTSGATPPGNSYTPRPIAVTAHSFGYPGETFMISADGTLNGVAWALDPGGSDLLALSTANFSTTLYDSNNSAADKLNGGVHFNVPTVANGMVYAGTGSGTLVVYGLRSSYLQSNASYFSAPTALVATAGSASGDVHLAWTSNSTLANEFRIDRSANGNSGWQTLGFVGNSWNTYDDTTVQPAATYFYRVVAIAGSNATAASNVAAFGPPPMLLSAVSRKTGATGVQDLNVALNATSLPGLTVEDRVDGPTQLVLTFAGPLVEGANFAVSLSTGSVSSANVNGSTLTIDLSGAANGQTLVMSINDVRDAATGVSGSYKLDLGVLAGDANGDGRVDVVDLGILATYFGQPGGATPAQGDLTGDGMVDVVDLGVLATNFGQTLTTASTGDTHTPTLRGAAGQATAVRARAFVRASARSPIS